MFNKAAPCKVFKIIAKVRYINKKTQKKKENIPRMWQQNKISLCIKKKVISASNIVGHYQSQCGFHHKWCTGITENLLIF